MSRHTVDRILALVLVLHYVTACAGELEGDPDDYRVSPIADAARPPPGAGGMMGGGGMPGTSGSGPAPDATPGACDPTPIFTAECTISVCHDSDAPAAGLDLTGTGAEVGMRLLDTSSSDSNCSDRVLIDSSDASQSFLLEKLNEADPQCGTQMPPLGTTLMPDQLTCIAEWVESVVLGG